jgi:hypothetical protein
VERESEGQQNDRLERERRSKAVKEYRSGGRRERKQKLEV